MSTTRSVAGATVARSLARAVAIAFVITLVATSCATSDGRSADYGFVLTPDLSDLAEHPWVADSIVDPDRDLVANTSISLTFTEDSVSLNAGCNTLFGAASIDGTELVVPQLASTRKLCEPPLGEQDTWLTTFITSRPTIERKDDNLWLSHDDTVIDFRPSDD